MNRNLMHVSDLLVAGFCTQTEDAIRAICKRALRKGQRNAGRPRQALHLLATQRSYCL